LGIKVFFSGFRKPRSTGKIHRQKAGKNTCQTTNKATIVVWLNKHSHSANNEKKKSIIIRGQKNRNVFPKKRGVFRGPKKEKRKGIKKGNKNSGFCVSV